MNKEIRIYLNAGSEISVNNTKLFNQQQIKLYTEHVGSIEGLLDVIASQAHSQISYDPDVKTEDFVDGVTYEIFSDISDIVYSNIEKEHSDQPLSEVADSVVDLMIEHGVNESIAQYATEIYDIYKKKMYIPITHALDKNGLSPIEISGFSFEKNEAVVVIKGIVNND